MHKKVQRKTCRRRRHRRVNPEAHPDITESREERSALRADFAEGKIRIDYSPQAVTRRLKQVDDLRRACLMLAGPRLKWDWRKTSDAVSRNLKKPRKKRH